MSNKDKMPICISFTCKIKYAMPQSIKLSENDIRAYLHHSPVALCIRELNRVVGFRSCLQSLNLTGDILDVGCGDGFWWTLLNDYQAKVHGIDINANELVLASKHLKNVAQVDISQDQPFNGKKFSLIIGNCSLEHIPNIDDALANISNSAVENATFLLYVPSPTWAFNGKTQEFLQKISPRMSMMLSGAMNGFFQHWHLYNYKVWSSLLEQNGWRIMNIYGLGNPKIEFYFRLFLPFAFPSFIFKKIMGVYPQKYSALFRLSFLCSFLSKLLANPFVDKDDVSAYEYMIIARNVRSKND